MDNTYDRYEHIYTFGKAENYELIVEMRELTDEISRRSGQKKFLVVEAYDKTENLLNYYEYNGKAGSHFPFNFQLIKLFEKTGQRYDKPNIPFTPLSLRELVNAWNDVKRPQDWSNWQLGNHDNPRIGSRIGSENIDLAHALILLIGGTPVTYYGEEIGMTDLPLSSLSYEDVQDEFGKKFGVKKHFFEPLTTLTQNFSFS